MEIKQDHCLARIMVEGDLPKPGKYCPWSWVELNVDVKDENLAKTSVPPPLKTILNHLAIYKMQRKVTTDVSQGHFEKATQRLQLLATQLLDIGETALANATLLEAGQIQQTRTLSAQGKKTIHFGTRMLATTGLPRSV